VTKLISKRQVEALEADLGPYSSRVITFGVEIRALAATVRQMAAALNSLSNETSGLLSVGGDALRDLVSITNVRCLERRIEAARALLAEWRRDDARPSR